jgi:hypothetical protein
VLTGPAPLGALIRGVKAVDGDRAGASAANARTNKTTTSTKALVRMFYCLHELKFWRTLISNRTLFCCTRGRPTHIWPHTLLVIIKPISASKTKCQDGTGCLALSAILALFQIVNRVTGEF